jgi:hypothetical protein
VTGSEVHHIYGRSDGNEDTLWKEHYTNLIVVSRQVHPGRILTPGGSEKLAYVETARTKANKAPINIRFKHTDEEPYPPLEA